MKKQIVTVVLGLTLVTGVTVYVATPQTPERYELHVVQYGETLESIILESNKDSNVDYDIREATAIAVAKSKKIEGGATSRQLKVGDNVAVPIYR